ncbi:MAG: ADP-glyceromanno-heptose 6-epimerase [Chlamydiae bacterium]|nr:ADP-glyceromanno-heptose 6-epimerase [Chlamydiota bacterium]
MQTKTFSAPLIIITGGAGFIGSAVVKQLNDLGMDQLLIVDDIKTSEKWKNLLGKRFVDFISKHTLFSFLQEKNPEIRAIIHLGACSDTLMKDGDYLMENNYRYTIRLAEYALKKEIRFIYASSAATYGDGRFGFSDHIDLLEELRPLNLYGLSKHLFDLWAKRQGVLHRIVGLKYFNIFGPNENHKGNMASMVFKMFPRVLNEGNVKLFRSSEPDRFHHGEQKRDFLYVKDAAKMTCQFLENEYVGIFNIGFGRPTTWNQLAMSLFKALDRKIQIDYIEVPEEMKKQYQNYTCADMTHYFKTHGYDLRSLPYQYSIEEGVEDYVQNYLMQDKRW